MGNIEKLIIEKGKDIKLSPFIIKKAINHYKDDQRNFDDIKKEIEDLINKLFKVPKIEVENNQNINSLEDEIKKIDEEIISLKEQLANMKKNKHI